MKAEFSSLAHHHITLCNCTIGKCFINATLLVRAVVKKKHGLFTVRLTVRVYPPIPPLMVRVS